MEWKNGSRKDSSDLILLYFALYNKYNLLVYQLNVTNKKIIKNGIVQKKEKMKKTESKKTETKKPTVGTKRPFWDGRSRASTPGYRENYNSIFKQKRNFRRSSKWKVYQVEELEDVIKNTKEQRKRKRAKKNEKECNSFFNFVVFFIKF